MSLLLTALLLLQEPAGPGAPPDAAPTPVDRIRAAMTGDFVGVERKDGREARGHICARALPGGFVARDYWSQAGERRVYAGHDVLELRADGGARHWWFGSRGDEAYAEGEWTPERLVLRVLDDDREVLRRYTYRLGVDGLAFHFANDHADGEGWEPFMETDWRREEVALPDDFLPDPAGVKGWRCSLVGAWESPAGPCRGRLLFDEWGVLELPDGHGVWSTGWFGSLELHWWDADGTHQRLEGEREDTVLRFRPAAEEDAPWSRVWELGERGLLRRKPLPQQDFRARG